MVEGEDCLRLLVFLDDEVVFPQPFHRVSVLVSYHDVDGNAPHIHVNHGAGPVAWVLFALLQCGGLLR